MSDGPIPLLGPDDLKFVPEPSDFSGLVGNELGTLGTNQDGFDAIFNDAAALASTAGTVLDSMDQDLADASFNLPEFDPSVPTNLMASLQPASDAADSVLNDYNTVTPPDPGGVNPPPPPPPTGTPPGTTIGGITIGQPDPNPYPAIPGPSGSPALKLGAMATDNTPTDVAINTEYGIHPDPVVQSTSLLSGDAAIFSLVYTDTIASGVNQSYRTFYLRVTPAKAGRFGALVKLAGTPTGDYYSRYNVTIVKP
jgi:hypothetical protein